MIPKIPLAEWIEWLVSWLQDHFDPVFQLIKNMIEPTVTFFTRILSVLPPLATIGILIFFILWITRIWTAILSLAGLLLIWNLGYWDESTQTLSLVLTSTLIAVIIGIPLGIWSGRNDRAQAFLKPILDFMQTMPAFVYLIPAVFFFSLGTVPGVIASVIFAMPPTIRFTSLGLRQVSVDLKEAAEAFGATSWQKLIKVEIPLAQQTILAGVNQTIMLSLSMVVTASMIGAEGIGAVVLESITRLKVGIGFESGLAIVIIAIILDRLTQNLNQNREDTWNRQRQIPFLAKTRKWAAPVAILTVLALTFTSYAQSGVKRNEIKLIYVNWVSEEASTYTLKNILEKEGFQVKVIRVDAGPMYDAIATGNADAMVAAWLPTTGAQYYDRYKKDLENLGVNLEKTRIGLVVPKYVNINSIGELASQKEQFDQKIIGIDPGSGTMLLAKETIKQYNLGMKLLEGSDAAMVAELDRAYKKKKPIVITGWTPHWMFLKYDLKYLDDPKKTFGEPENIYTLVRKGFKEDQPEAFKLIDQFFWTARDMEEVMLDVANGMSPDQAAKKWIEKHPSQVAEITTGVRKNK
ncbi:ABC transporter permease/substrate binding protein [Baia soyae]|uniref:Glycine betaine/proline transport system substrate-binding protein n=1 Tax=Baia soyae TaxID=1544746 RepID=A0A4R2RBA7_9BACL|nr:ABC transporter permease/substrate binding protein [Baia soyae]TCP60612.1 glycine betaine/proline transport system substrate-binding protein [Baia soyae]